MISFFATSLGRKLLIGAGVVIALAALAWGAHALYNDIKQSGRDEVQAQWDKAEAARQLQRAEMNADLTNAIGGIGDQLHTLVTGITGKQQRILTTVKLDMANDPRYTSASCSLTPSVLNSVNTARRGTADPSATVITDEGELSGFEPAVRIDLGSIGGG